MIEFFKPFADAYFDWLWIVVTGIGAGIGWHCGGTGKLSPLFWGWLSFTLMLAIGATIGRL